MSRFCFFVFFSFVCSFFILGHHGRYDKFVTKPKKKIG